VLRLLHVALVSIAHARPASPRGFSFARSRRFSRLCSLAHDPRYARDDARSRRRRAAIAQRVERAETATCCTGATPIRPAAMTVA
jgi:hypothetical protein